MNLAHGYLVGDMAKVIRNGKMLADHEVIEQPTPWGIIRFDRQVWRRVSLLHGTLTICSAALGSTIPVGEQVTTP